MGLKELLSSLKNQAGASDNVLRITAQTHALNSWLARASHTDEMRLLNLPGAEGVYSNPQLPSSKQLILLKARKTVEKLKVQ